jgi:MFS family permease
MRYPERLRDSIWTRLGIVGQAGTGIVGYAGERADRALDRAQVQVFRFLWLFLPAPSVAQDIRFQHLLFSRFLSEAGQQTLAFGALVSVAREGGSALDVALVGIAGLLPPAILGLSGGFVADQLPKRIALAGAYVAQALLCFAVPTFFDTGSLTVVILLLLAFNALGQVSSPTESAVIPMVASDEQLASAASLIGLAAAIGQGFATALFAPVVVKAFGVDPVIYLSGALLLIAASRVFDLPVGDDKNLQWRVHLPPMTTQLRVAVRWLVRHPAVGSMIVFSVLAGTVNIVLVTLAPRYAVAVLNADPANTAYVFAPSAIGVGVALLVAPFAIKRFGERATAMTALFVAALSLFLLGAIGTVSSIVDPVNPLHAASWVGISMNDRVRTAGLLAIPLAFGVTLTATSVQTYINRHVPITHQSRTFALQGTLRNGTAVVPLLTLGVAAGEFGADKVLLFSPLVLLAVAYGLVAVSFRISGLQVPSRLQVVESFWEEPMPPSGGIGLPD